MQAKRVFITGASSGLGAGLARKYGVAGATVGLVARRTELLAALAAELRAQGATAHVYPGDVADTAGMTRIAREFTAAAGGVDLVVANAGVGIKSALREGDAESVARLMQINVIGVTNTVIPFIPTMIAQRSGALVAIGSMAGHRALPGRVAYSASKKAVATFMDGLRMDLHGTGVHAMTICPGFVKTPMTDGMTKMPFLVELEDAVELMAGAIDHHKRTYTFPWQMNMMRHVMVRAPEWLIRRTAPKPRAKNTF